MKILIVDSHVLFRQGLASMLDGQPDMNVIGEAGYIREAIEKALALKPDLVLLDIILPDGDGMDALRVISSQLPGTKTVILTTYDTDEMLFTAIRHGAKGYLLKNTPIAKLTAAIRALERGEAAISRSMAGRLVEEFSRTMAGLEPIQNGTSSLTQREREIFELLGTGAANREIASRLSIAENTVKIHVHNILEKLNLSNRTEAGRLARYLLLGQVSQEMP